MNPSKILIYVWLAAFVGACNASRPLAAAPRSSALQHEPVQSRDAKAAQDLGSEQILRPLHDAMQKIKAECWQPALDARTSDVPMPVRIPTRIKVAPAGIVAEVEVGDAPPELSTLSPCIAAALKNLRFRAIPKPTELSIQFVFDVS